MFLLSNDVQTNREWIFKIIEEIIYFNCVYLNYEDSYCIDFEILMLFSVYIIVSIMGGYKIFVAIISFLFLLAHWVVCELFSIASSPIISKVLLFHVVSSRSLFTTGFIE